MNDCIFCKIIEKKLQADILYEDRDIIAFLDINPVAKGHCLVVPKKHYENLLDTDDNILSILLKKIKIIAEKILKVIDKEGFNLILNNGRSAGQLINHIHFHIIPRSKDDGINMEWNNKYVYSEGEKEKIIKRINEMFK